MFWQAASYRLGDGPLTDRWRKRMPTLSLKPIKREDFGYDEARHLLNRAGFGGGPAQIESLVALGPQDAVDHLLNFEEAGAEPVQAGQFDAGIMQPLSQEQRREVNRARQAQDEQTLARYRTARQQRQRQDRQQMRQIQEWWLERFLNTTAPLQEKMTLFWHGHFATSYRTIEDSYHMFLQNQLFRRHAVGSFADLARGIIRDPAMLEYLDNDQSRKGRPNENLARELMELFCLGVGNYSENDIKEGARALTGYTFEDDAFIFRNTWHDGGVKEILGESGAMNGDDFLAVILGRQACAEFIAAKLLQFFVTGPIDEEDVRRARQYSKVVGKLAGTLRQGEYALRPMLRELFLSQHFYDPAHRHCCIKSPVELLVGTVRLLKSPQRDMRILLAGLDRMGQHLMYPPSVKGWEGGRSWINTSTLFVRQNAATYLISGDGRSESDYNPMSLLRGLRDPTPEGACKHLLRLCLGSLMREEHVKTLRAFLSEHEDNLTAPTVKGLLALITTMPEYQLC